MIHSGGPSGPPLRLHVEWACKPDSVEDDHLSGTAVADGLKRANPSAGRAGLNRSYLPLLRVGFAKPPRCRDAGALLPHRFSFSPDQPFGRAGESSFLWHFPSACAALPLAGTLPCGVRTFLTRRAFRHAERGRPAHSVTYSSRRDATQHHAAALRGRCFVVSSARARAFCPRPREGPANARRILRVRAWSR